MSRTVDRQIANRYTGNAQTTSRSRDSTPSTAPPKKPAARPISVPNRQVRSAARDADQQRVAAAVQQAGRDVAALVVGAEEVVLRIPRRADRRHAEPEPSRFRLHHRHGLAVHDRRSVEIRAEGVRVCDVVRVERRREAEQDDHGEHGEHRHRDLVARQPATGKRPGAGSCGARRGRRGGRHAHEGVAHRRPCR